jgi:hypothetical protein
MIALLSINFNKPNYKNLTEHLFKDECANNSYFKLLLKLIFLCFYIKLADYLVLAGYLFIPNFYQTNAHTPIHIYLCVCVCVCVCIYI